MHLHKGRSYRDKGPLMTQPVHQALWYIRPPVVQDLLLLAVMKSALPTAIQQSALLAGPTGSLWHLTTPLEER